MGVGVLRARAKSVIEGRDGGSLAAKDSRVACEMKYIAVEPVPASQISPHEKGSVSKNHFRGQGEASRQVTRAAASQLQYSAER